MSITTSALVNSTAAETGVDGPRWRFLPLVVVPLWILAGNWLVLLAVVRQRSLRTLSNSVIASLAFADFLLAVLVVPLGVYQLVSSLAVFVITIKLLRINRHYLGSHRLQNQQVSGEERNTSFLFQRLSVALQCWNAVLLHSTFLPESDPYP